MARLSDKFITRITSTGTRKCTQLNSGCFNIHYMSPLIKHVKGLKGHHYMFIIIFKVGID